MFELLRARLPKLLTGPAYDAGMAKSAHAAAEEIRRRLPGVGNVKVHKLLYYAQGHHLATFGQPLFEETISAWDMGPVVGTLWKHEDQGDPPAPVTDALNEAELNTVGYVVSRYGGLTGKDLIRLSHGETPWQRANEHRASGTSVRISPDSIRDYFAEVADEDEEAFPPLDSQLLKEMLSDAVDRWERPAIVDSMDEVAARRAELLG